MGFLQHWHALIKASLVDDLFKNCFLVVALVESEMWVTRRGDNLDLYMVISFTL